MRWIGGPPGGWVVGPPVSLDFLGGPSNGRHMLPAYLTPAAPWRVYDLGSHSDAVAYAETALRYATLPADLVYLSAGLLDRYWPVLALPAGFRERWESGLDGLAQ